MIKVYLTEKCTLIQTGGIDENNSPLQPAEIERDCKIEWKFKKITEKTGEETVSTGTVLMEHTPTITAQDSIKIAGKEYGIISISHPAQFSLKVTEVYLK